MARRLNDMQREFVKHMARTGDAEYSAEKAGYASPAVAGWKLMNQQELVANATREETRRFLLQDAGQIAVGILVEIGTDAKQPAGARVNAADKLAKLSGIAIGDEGNAKDPSEMDGNELRVALDKMERQKQAVERALADRAKPVIEADTSLFD